MRTGAVERPSVTPCCGMPANRRAESAAPRKAAPEAAFATTPPREEFAGRFRARALQAGTGSLVLGVGGLLVADASAPGLFARLTDTASPLVLLALGCLVLSLLAMGSRRYALARAASLLAGAALLWGWFIAQSPHLVGPLLTIRTAAATPPALTATAIACGVVLLGVIPAVFLLFSTFAGPSQR